MGFNSTLIITLLATMASAHEGESHGDGQKKEGEALETPAPKEILDTISSKYLNDIKSIFRKKCYDCHGSGNPLPWYAVIPGPKHIIEDDIKEAKKHMDMSKDFPFGGHGSPEEDLTSLAKTVKEDSMPPFRYWILHWSSSLSENEKEKILQWIKESLILLENKKEYKNQ